MEVSDHLYKQKNLFACKKYVKHFIVKRFKCIYHAKNTMDFCEYNNQPLSSIKVGEFLD
jgi:hypothetical protein